MRIETREKMRAPWDTKLLLVLSVLCVCPCGIFLASAERYKPVIVVHGLFDGPKQFMELTRFIIEAHPGTNVSVIDLYDDLNSLKPLWQQVRGFRGLIYPIIQEAKDGVHLICFSQGGLVCRGLLSILPDHNVQSFISLSSPQAGQYGDTSYLRWVFPVHLKRNVFHLCYSDFGQKISICNFWNDPHQQGRFLNSSIFLALINGERPHSQMEVWRKNILRIRRLVLIGGPDDGVVTPWQSSFFGFYDSNETVVDMKDQECYQKDTFGLKTLDARGDLTVCVFSGVQHTSWHSNHTVFRDCIEKWLT